MSSPPALERVPLRDPGLPVPDEALRLITEADACSRAHLDRPDSPPSPGFLAGDHEATYRALAEVHRRRLAPGPRFCEWGCGFGVATLLAAQLGFEATGIEYHGHLVDEARALARRWDLTATFATGNFLPSGCDRTGLDPFTCFPRGAEPDGHRALGIRVRDLDVVYVYLWPDGERGIHRLFARLARPGALLLTYQGDEWLDLHRVTP